MWPMTYEEAIDCLQANYPDSRYELLREAVDMAINALRRSDRRKATWLKKDGTYVCSLCRHLGQEAHENDNPEWLWAFCPCCGAKMERER